MNRIGGGNKSPVTSPARAGNNRQQNQRRQQQEQQTVNDWETRWDDDSDDEDDDVKPNVLPQQKQHPVAGADAVPATSMSPQLRPPELDSGYAGAASAAASVITPLTTELQSQQQQQPVFPPTSSTAAAATPVPLAAPQSPLKSKLPQSSQPVTDDENDDDGMEWDTGAAGNDAGLPADGELEDTSVPNVKQFLPLLRVLGKGSFGKVRFASLRLVYLI